MPNTSIIPTALPPSSSPSQTTPASTSLSVTKTKTFSVRKLLHKTRPKSMHSNDSNTTLIAVSSEFSDASSKAQNAPSEGKSSPDDSATDEQAGSPSSSSSAPRSTRRKVKDTTFGKFGERHAVEGVTGGIPSRVWA